MPVRILHTADVHLDAPLRFLGEKGGEQRAQIRRTFEAITELAKNHDILLIAGDLFDSNSVVHSTMEWVIACLRRLAVPVVILPGTHDCAGLGSVYNRPEWQSARNIHIFKEKDSPQSFSFPESQLIVHGRPVGKDDTVSPLSGIVKSEAFAYNVALAHGSITSHGLIPEDTACPIRLEDIDAGKMDYIALGHWHSWYQPSERVVYPGSPELLKFGQSTVSVSSVVLDGSACEITAIEIGTRHAAEQTVLVDGLDSTDALTHEIERIANPNLAARITLAGLANAGFVIDLEEIRSALENSFFYLEISDETHPRLDAAEFELDARTIAGRFASAMADKIQSVQEPERRYYEDALQLGLALLQGKKVLL